MVLEPLVMQVFGAITAKTVPAVLDFLGDRLKALRGSKQGKVEAEIEALTREIEDLRRQLQETETIEDEVVRRVETDIEKAYSLQQQYGLELISDQAHKQWILKQFEELGSSTGFKSSFKVDIWTQEGTSGVARDVNIVPVTTPRSYSIGDKVTFFFRSNHDCYLTIFNLGTSSAVTLLFPNRLFPDNFIRADHVYSIPGEGYPFEYVLSGPPGIERIRAVASMERINLTSPDFSEKNMFFYSAERSSAAKDIRIVEKRMKEQPSTSWATAACEFMVR